MNIANILYDNTADLLRSIFNWRISGPPVFEFHETFSSIVPFSKEWQRIKVEALNISANISSVPRFHEIMSQQSDISANDKHDWRMFIVKAYGVIIPKNASRCPVLAELVSSNPDILTATLSFLAPHKHIPKHRGPFRGVIRYYLGLSVPLTFDGQPSTVLTIDGTEYRIGDGQWILWDDTYEHEVLNKSNEMRIALLLDVRRKGMPLDMELLSRILIAVASVGVRLRKFD